MVSIGIQYRRKKPMDLSLLNKDISPADDYSANNQTLSIHVKDIVMSRSFLNGIEPKK